MEAAPLFRVDERSFISLHFLFCTVLLIIFCGQGIARSAVRRHTILEVPAARINVLRETEGQSQEKKGEAARGRMLIEKSHTWAVTPPPPSLLHLDWWHTHHILCVRAPLLRTSGALSSSSSRGVSPQAAGRTMVSPGSNSPIHPAVLPTNKAFAKGGALKSVSAAKHRERLVCVVQTFDDSREMCVPVCNPRSREGGRR